MKFSSYFSFQLLFQPYGELVRVYNEYFVFMRSHRFHIITPIFLSTCGKIVLLISDCRTDLPAISVKTRQFHNESMAST